MKTTKKTTTMTAAQAPAIRAEIELTLSKLVAIATNPKIEAGERAEGRAQLQALYGKGVRGAREALERVDALERGLSRAGVQFAGGIEHRGTREIQHTMTPAQARAKLAGRKVA